MIYKVTRAKYNHLHDQRIKTQFLAIAAVRPRKVEGFGLNNITLQNSRTRKIVKVCPQEVKDELTNYYMKMRRNLQYDFPSLPNFDFDEEMVEIDNEEEDHGIGKRMTGKSSQRNSNTTKKRPKKRPLSQFVMPPPEKMVQICKMKQATIRNAYDNEVRENACQYIAH